MHILLIILLNWVRFDIEQLLPASLFENRFDLMAEQEGKAQRKDKEKIPSILTWKHLECTFIQYKILKNYNTIVLI